MNLQTVVTDIAGEIAAQAAAIEASADARDASAEPGPFGIAVVTADEMFTAGAAATPFPIQSISKVFALERALCRFGTGSSSASGANRRGIRSIR